MIEIRSDFDKVCEIDILFSCNKGVKMESAPVDTKGMVDLTNEDREILQPVINGAEEASGVGDDQKEKLGMRAIKVKIQNFEFNGSLDVDSGIMICSNYSQMFENGEVKDSIAGQIANLAFQFDNFKVTVSKELKVRDIEIERLKRKISGPRPIDTQVIRCWQCQRFGHRREDCSQNQKNEDKSAVKSEKKEHEGGNSGC